MQGNGYETHQCSCRRASRGRGATRHRKHTAKAGAKGNATIGYYISGATPGYKVVVSVRVVKGKRSGSCSTWFIPHR
jgi:hypothetical protein